MKKIEKETFSFKLFLSITLKEDDDVPYSIHQRQTRILPSQNNERIKNQIRSNNRNEIILKYQRGKFVKHLMLQCIFGNKLYEVSVVAYRI